MLLEVRRQPSADGCTLGTLYVDGEFECFTLEDVIREIPEKAVQTWKVDGETAIPSGSYQVTVTMSARFKKLLPLLVDVPGFQGVRIHSGNVAADTEGCILVGDRQDKVAVLDSRRAFQGLFQKIQAAIKRDESVYIRITNPPVTQPPSEVLVT
jgi:hypothetical protein